MLRCACLLSACFCLLLLFVATQSFFNALDVDRSTISSSVFTSDLSADDTDEEPDLSKHPDSLEMEAEVIVHVNQLHPDRKKSLASIKSITSSRESYPTLPPLSEESESESEALMNNASSFQDCITFEPLPSKRYTPPLILVEDASHEESFNSTERELQFEEFEPLSQLVVDTAKPGVKDTCTEKTRSPSQSSLPPFFSHIFARRSQATPPADKLKSIELNNVTENHASTKIEIPELDSCLNLPQNHRTSNGGDELNSDSIENIIDSQSPEAESLKPTLNDCAVM